MRVNGRRKVKSGGKIFETFGHVEDDISQFELAWLAKHEPAWRFRLEQATRTALGELRQFNLTIPLSGSHSIHAPALHCS